MRIAVCGLWHLGSVTAACLAAAGHDVTGIEEDPTIIGNLTRGVPPLFEPGLQELIRSGEQAERLTFTSNPKRVGSAEVVWVTYDTPVDDNDVADVESVIGRVRSLYPFLPDGCLVLVSSQLPVGSTRGLARDYASLRRTESVTFGYSPENLRLGKAIDVFRSPDRIVVGLAEARDKDKVAKLLSPFTENVVWMSIESAEMTKHALNAFLATSVTFANEIAAVCEQVGADAREVEQGLKSESRIGPGAYLSAGAAFAGGTLARDVMFVASLGEQLGLPLHVIPSVKVSNDKHRSWPLRRLAEMLGGLHGRTVALLGLTYKPGTDTLRRSSAVELAVQLVREGARVTAFDPAIRELPQELKSVLSLCDSALIAMRGASAVVLATPWPEFKKLDWASAFAGMSQPILLDANRFVSDAVRNMPAVGYAAVGLGARPVPEAKS